jgi:hypothetical protein
MFLKWYNNESLLTTVCENPNEGVENKIITKLLRSNSTIFFKNKPKIINLTFNLLKICLKTDEINTLINKFDDILIE